MNITIGQGLLLMGIPSALTGLFVWLLKRWLEKKDKRAEERSKMQVEIMLSNVNATNAALSLAEATAQALQRMPDANCNGDMHEALEYAKKTKHEQRELMQKLGIARAVS